MRLPGAPRPVVEPPPARSEPARRAAPPRGVEARLWPLSCPNDTGGERGSTPDDRASGASQRVWAAPRSKARGCGTTWLFPPPPRHSRTAVTVPAPTVRPPSRIAIAVDDISQFQALNHKSTTVDAGRLPGGPGTRKGGSGGWQRADERRGGLGQTNWKEVCRI
jgi:hypothetical protein